MSGLVATLLAGTLAFGPADPVPPRAATCFDAAADTIAIGRETNHGWVIEASTAAGPWQRVLGPAAVKGPLCPVLPAAPDGTAIVAAGDRPAQVAIRPPGGSFGPSATLTLRVPAYLPEGSDDFRFEIAVAAADRAGNQRRRSVGLWIKRS